LWFVDELWCFLVILEILKGALLKESRNSLVASLSHKKAPLESGA